MHAHSLESPSDHILSFMPSKAPGHMLVQGIVKAGKRFGDIISYMSLDDNDLNVSSFRSSRSKKSRSRSIDRKKSKQNWVPIDESNPEFFR